VGAALDAGSDDNLSAVVVYLRDPGCVERVY
jgi:hypothetical protein